MALPPGITPKTVTVGLASFFDGTLTDGTVSITAPVNVVHTPTNRPIFSSVITQKFVDGAASFTLCPTDDPGLNRVDWTYKLNVNVSGALVQPDPIYFTLPAAGPDTVDLDGLVTVPSSAGTPISITAVTSVAGNTGTVTGAQLAADSALRAALVPFWTAGEVLTAGKVRMAPDGHVIQRIADGTARGSYDATEQGNWTVIGGGAGYTDEQAQDAVAAMIAAGTTTGATWTYDDTGNKLSLTVTGASLSTAAQRWLTTSDGTTSLFASQADIPFVSLSGVAKNGIVVDPQMRHQTHLGVGAAMTDGACWVLWTYLSQAQRTALLTELFHPVTGMCDAIRLPMGAVDHTVGTPNVYSAYYTYSDLPAGQTDTTALGSFSIEHDLAYIIPVLREIYAINPKIKAFAAPWSPPGWMKTSGTITGGAINPTYYQHLANYFVKFIQAYAALGIPVYAVSVQNEPDFPSNSYPACTWTAAQNTLFIGSFLGPALQTAGLATRIVTGDVASRPSTTFWTDALSNATATQYIDGVSMHAYGPVIGPPNEMALARRAYPERNMYTTELCSLTVRNFSQSLAAFIPAIFNDLRNYSLVHLFWNLALDQNYQPFIPQGGGGYEPVVVVPNNSSGNVSRRSSYYVLAHLGRYIKPGATRIGSTSSITGVITVAYQNLDNSIVVAAYNSTGASVSTIIEDARGNAGLPITLAAGDLVTLTWASTPTTSTAIGSTAGPTGLAATGNGGYLTLSWTEPTSGVLPSAYRIEKGASAGTLAAYRTVPATGSYVDRTVTSGTAYYYRLTPVGAGGFGTPTSTVNATVAAAAVPTVAASGTSLVTITATAAAGAAAPDYFIIRRATGSGGTLADLITIKANGATSITYQDGPAIGTYDYTAKAVYGANTSADSSRATVTVSGPGNSGNVMTDLFTRTSTTALGSPTTRPGMSDVSWFASTATWGTNGSQAYVVAPPASGYSLAIITSNFTDYTIDCDLPAAGAAAAFPGIVARIDGGANTGILILKDGIYNMTSRTAATLLQSHSSNFAAGDHMTAIFSGSSITVRKNGIQVSTVTSTVNQTQPRLGMVLPFDTDTGLARWDNYYVSNP